MQLCEYCGKQISYNCSQCNIQMCYNYNCFNYPLSGICSMYCIYKQVGNIYLKNQLIIQDQQEKFAIIELNNKKINVWTKAFLRKYMIGALANIVLEY